MTARLRRRRCRATPRGMAMVTAIVLVGVVAMSMVLLSSLTRAQWQHTRHVDRDAQLRQLLLAGERVAALHVHAAPTDAERDQTVPTPAALGDRAALALRWDVARNAERTVQVRAAIGEHAVTQRLTYRRDGEGWILERAILE